ncbi:MAG TPA: tetratricopeptide repeat protein, partial [Ramlibacter sp.]|nr:tetratricopeptide repeat protein [Ramlibacter sp.]
MAVLSVSSLRVGLCTLLFCSSMAHGQEQRAPAACPVQPRYPLSNDPAQLQVLAAALERVASDPGCLKDASFHAWRGAILVATGHPAEAVESLERALLIEPDLPGAALDLAQAFAQLGDQASATALLDRLRQRNDLPEPIRIAIDQRRAALASQAVAGRNADGGTGWHSRWQVSGLVGYDTNLNNAPFRTEITLTLPDPVLVTLDPAARPQKGAALLTSALWQGLKAQG